MNEDINELPDIHFSMVKYDKNISPLKNSGGDCIFSNESLICLNDGYGNMWQTFLVLLKTSRPPLWMVLPMVYCLGLVYGQNGLTDSSFRFTPVIMFQMFMLSFPICFFIFGLNDIYDHSSDQINPRKKGLEGIRLDPSYHGTVKMVSLIAGLAFLCISMTTGNLINIYFSITILCLAYVYSVPPWRLKIRAPFDVISAGILGLFAPFALAYSLVDDVKTIPFQVYYFTLCVMGLHAFSTIMDYTVDQCVGDQTFAVTFGKRIAALFPAVIFLFSPFFTHVIYIKIFFMFCFLLCIVFIVIPSDKLARYFFLTMFIGAFSVLSIWILFLCYGK